MKKHLLSLFAAAAMLFATSCSEEELTYENGNKQNVTFKVAVEGAGVSSRTIADGENHITIGEGKLVNKLFYAVYETGKADCLWEGEATVSNGLATVVIPLVNGLKYDLVFLAYNDKDNAFGISKELTFSKNLCGAVDLTNLTLKSGLVANQEAYDAFYHVEPNYVTKTNSTTPVKLKRMFAQLNVATTDTDLSNAKQLGAEITQSDITLKKVPNKFNARTGDVDGEVTVTFAQSKILKCSDVKQGQIHDNEQLTVQIEGVDKNFNYLAMAYVLAGAESSLHDIEVSFYRGGEDDVEKVYTRPIASVPLQRQYRTNVTGNILTQQEAFDISLDLNFGDHNKSVGDVVIIPSGDSQALKAAIENAQPNVPVEIQLQGNIVLGGSRSVASSRSESDEPTEALLIKADQDIILDLNGCTISHEYEQKSAYAMIENNGTLTIINSASTEGKIEYKDKATLTQAVNYASNTIKNNGKLTIEEGVTIINDSQESVATYGYPHPIDNNGELVINGGTFTNKANYSSMRIWCTTDDNTIVTINGGTFIGSIDFHTPSASANKGTLIINEGTFKADTYTNCAVRLLGFGTDVDEMNGYIKGGNFIGKIALNNYVGGDFNSQVFYISGGTFNTDPSAFVDDNCKVVVNEGVWTIVAREPIAKIGSTEYVTLQAAFDNVKDGETITLLDDITIDSNAAYQANEEYTDGVRYTGDKSFTIDFNGKTVTDDGCVNDYLIYVNNKGEKDNEITFMNGTIISKNGCWSTVCVNSSTATHATVLNLVGMNITNSNDAEYSGNPVVRTRNMATVNVGENTIITSNGASYGIAANTSASIVNINAGAKVIQQNSGTTGGNSVFAAVGGKGTINIYDGSEITSDRYGVHTMTTGTPVVNVYGGTITAEVALKASTNGGTGELAYIYVTGGIINGKLETYTNNGHIVVSGGTFNVDPTYYLVDGYEAVKSNGVWTIKTLPVAKIGETEYETMEAAAAAAQAGSTITVLRDVTLSEALTLPADIIFNGNGKQINGTISAGGNLTFEGHTKVTAFSATYYNRTITIGEGACLEVTGTGRATLGYGNTFDITGTIENAKTADKANIQPSLIIPGGISITGGNDAAINVTNAYVKIGSTTSKPGVANGKFILGFKNSIVEFTKELGFYDPTGGMTPKFFMNITNSVFTTGTKLFVTADSNVVVDNSTVSLGSYIRNSGIFTLKNGSVLTGATIQFGENGGNNGTINVDNSTLTVTASSTGHAFDGQGVGSINLTNSANANVDYYKNMTISVDKTSTFIGTEVK